MSRKRHKLSLSGQSYNYIPLVWASIHCESKMEETRFTSWGKLMTNVHSKSID